MSQKGLAVRSLVIVGPLPCNRLGPKILMGTEKKTYDILKANSWRSQPPIGLASTCLPPSLQQLSFPAAAAMLHLLSLHQFLAFCSVLLLHLLSLLLVQLLLLLQRCLVLLLHLLLLKQLCLLLLCDHLALQQLYLGLLVVNQLSKLVHHQLILPDLFCLPLVAFSFPARLWRIVPVSWALSAAAAAGFFSVRRRRQWWGRHPFWEHSRPPEQREVLLGATRAHRPRVLMLLAPSGPVGPVEAWAA